jgi:DNA-3-methyladenine glycosylase I
MDKTVSRCAWAEGVSADYLDYHDTEWGVPVFDDAVHFEFLILEGAPVNNARRFLEVQQEYGSFSRYIWGFVDGRPMQKRYEKDSDIPATSAESDALSKDLKKRGFKFVGSTIVYAHMQATGLVNDHVITCFRHAPCTSMAQRSP